MSGPRNRSTPIPETNMLLRAGKIRLGDKATSQTGKLYPRAIDHFRVEADASGITSPEAAQAFHDYYGDEPRELTVWLPGNRLEDCLTAAWRLYGYGGRLKRKCDRHADLEDPDSNARCDERREKGGWNLDQHCICQARGLDGTDDGCVLTYTLSLLLPDIAGFGVWQIDTGSVISVRRMATALRTLQAVRGSLLWAEIKLGLEAVKVQPEGMASTTVYVLAPQVGVGTETLRNLAESHRLGEPLVGAPPVNLPLLPPPAADETPDGYVGLPASAYQPDAPESIEKAVRRQLDELTAEHKAVFVGLFQTGGVLEGKPQKVSTIVEHYGEAARDLAACLEDGRTPSAPQGSPSGAGDPPTLPPANVADGEPDSTPEALLAKWSRGYLATRKAMSDDERRRLGIELAKRKVAITGVAVAAHFGELAADATALLAHLETAAQFEHEFTEGDESTGESPAATLL